MIENDFYFDFDEFLKGAEISDQNTETDTLIMKLSDSYWEYYRKNSILNNLETEIPSLSTEQKKGLVLLTETMFRSGFLLGYSECETKHNPSYKPDPRRILRKVAP